MTISFHAPASPAEDALHHDQAAAGNLQAAQSAVRTLSDALSGAPDYNKLLLRAAAGAGKSYALVRMVKEALDHANCTRIAVTAFANKFALPEGVLVASTVDSWQGRPIASPWPSIHCPGPIASMISTPPSGASP